MSRASLESALTALPWLAELKSKLVEASPCFHETGAPIALSPHELTIVVEGELEEWREGRLLGIVEAPAVLGLHTAVLGTPSSSELRAATPATTVALPAHELRDGPAIALALAQEVETLRQGRFEARTQADDFFDRGAALVPGPYRFGPFDCHLVVMRGNASRIRALLPPGLAPAPGTEGHYLLAFTAIENARVGHREGPAYRYREITPFLPCIGMSGPGMYVPELYPESYMAILLGREIYGFPKRLGRITSSKRGFDLIADDRRLVRARYDEREPLAADDYVDAFMKALFPRVFRRSFVSSLGRQLTGAFSRLGVPAALRRARVFVRKRMLDERAEREASFRIDELVEIPFVVDSVSDYARYRRFELDLAPHSVFHGRAAEVFACRLGFSFGAGIRRVDYLTGQRRGAA